MLWDDQVMTGIRVDVVPTNVDGPAIVAAAAGLMLLPNNASKLVRLHRLAALGLALDDLQARSLSPSALRSLLKAEDLGSPYILSQEDPYSEVLIQSISFSGGPYLVSPGSGDHSVADLENLVDSLFRESWMPDEMRSPVRYLVQGLLTVSDLVLKRAGLARGALPGEFNRNSVEVPGAARLNELASAAFVSNEDLDGHGSWLRTVVDTFALEAGQLSDPCANDIMDDRLYVTPFLRRPDGYQVVVPLDLLVSIRFHVLRMAMQYGQLEELGRRWRASALRRFQRLLPRSLSLSLLEEDRIMNRYLLELDGRRQIHVVVATDPLSDWRQDVWGHHDTRRALDRLRHLMKPEVRTSYSTADELAHLVIIDSPGRSAFWGIPNVVGADPVLVSRSNDLEVIMHHEPDGPLGLLLFAQAIERRPGESMSTGLLDEFCSYEDHEKSFYFSDGRPVNFTVFQTGDGLYPRRKFFNETDRHGVIPPIPSPPILQARRRYRRDAPEIFIIEPGSSYFGYVVELDDKAVFVTIDLASNEQVGAELNILEAVAYWVRECVVHAGAQIERTTEIEVSLGDPEVWRQVREWTRSEPAVQVLSGPTGFRIDLSETFVALLQEETNAAERELVAALLVHLFGISANDLEHARNTIAPLGAKRMLSAFDQNSAPDMLADSLPRPLTGHKQVMAQLLDELGEWLRLPSGGGYSVGPFTGDDRVAALNKAVAHLFSLLETEIAKFDGHSLLEFLIAQNEALVHDAAFNGRMLRSRLACFGEQSDTVTELVAKRKTSASAQRANRFLVEYVAARPPSGATAIAVRDYYRLLSIAKEISDRGTTSDFLHYGLADFEVSILESGRLGLSQDEPVNLAMDTHAGASGLRSVRAAQLADASSQRSDGFDFAAFLSASETAMHAEFGFSLDQMREVCGGLLDLTSADQVARIDRSHALAEIVANRDLTPQVVKAVLDKITLAERSSFLSIGADAWPWRFNRDQSYVRRPVVSQGTDLVFGFRSIYRLGPYWVDNLLSGRLQGRAASSEMKRCISDARRLINDDFARAVARRLEELGLKTRLSVKKVNRRRIVDASGNDLGDIDVLAYDPDSRSILAVEAKDFEVARTPAEMANELVKLFDGKGGKQSTVQLHSKRVEWLRANQADVARELGIDSESLCLLAGFIVTDEPLITPLVTTSQLPVLPLDDVDRGTLGLRRTPPVRNRSRTRRD